MTTHQLTLATESFNAITSGNKTIESRLYDEKRQKIQIGDQIIGNHSAKYTVSVRYCHCNSQLRYCWLCCRKNR
ncbi:MAG: ASCH domain-containing protein [Candidatus Saccharimonas sp.]